MMSRDDTRPTSNRKLDRWRRSPEFAEISRRAIREWNALRSTLPKCGAKRRYDGQPCQQFPRENGRCRFHGGKTPKGSGWHKIAMPERGEPDGRFERRLAEAAKRKKKRATVLAAMTPEQRQAHEAWHKSHRPGSSTDRARARHSREAAALVSSLIEAAYPKTIDEWFAYRGGIFG